MNDSIKNLNVWESSLKEKFTFLQTIEELRACIKKNNLTDIVIHDKQLPNQPHKSFLDKNSDENNISITYTDQEHPISIIILNAFHREIIINPIFFEKYKNEIKEILKEQIKEQIKSKDISISIEVVK